MVHHELTTNLALFALAIAKCALYTGLGPALAVIAFWEFGCRVECRFLTTISLRRQETEAARSGDPGRLLKFFRVGPEYDATHVSTSRRRPALSFRKEA